jgi:hypothetical protein
MTDATNLSRSAFWVFLVALSGLAPPGAGAAPLIVGANYQDTKSNPNCNTANCSLSFTTVPAGKNLTITNLSCKIETVNVAQTPDLILLDSALDRIVDGLPQFLSNKTVGSNIHRYFASNDQVLHIVQGGKVPGTRSITPGVAGSIRSFRCTIGGQLR